MGVREDVWAELERRGATVAAVPFSGWAGEGGRVGTITLSRSTGGELVDVERWSGRDELTAREEQRNEKCERRDKPVWRKG